MTGCDPDRSAIERSISSGLDLCATRQRPDGSIDALLQFSTEHGQMLGVAIACGRFLVVFHTVHLLSISCRKLVIFGGTD